MPSFAPSEDPGSLYAQALRRVPLSLKHALMAAALVFATILFAKTLGLPPVHADSTSVRRGAELFAQNGCSHCHGTNGIGGGQGPDLKDVKRRMSPEAMTAQIHNGGKNMPPYGDALDAQQIEDLVDYLRSKRKPASPPAAAAPSPAKPVLSPTDPSF